MGKVLDAFRRWFATVPMEVMTSEGWQPVPPITIDLQREPRSPAEVFRDPPSFAEPHEDFPRPVCHTWVMVGVNHGWDTDYRFCCLHCYASCTAYQDPHPDQRVTFASDAMPSIGLGSNAWWGESIDDFDRQFPDGATCQQVVEWRRHRLALAAGRKDDTLTPEEAIRADERRQTQLEIAGWLRRTKVLQDNIADQVEFGEYRK